ncbi:hypothetical protein SAMN02745170_02566 [Propionispora hippei DSM 15287]|uniref:Uncharacterized protein n=1 Tax=Propionispora hippei DSM 15287 TaxID=1123003 RepID=A0A1M6JDU2_9FIRM|nr:hypothetical protein SAMN02745170_02566 [Propionispora hippei DSM 15287]
MIAGLYEKHIKLRNTFYMVHGQEIPVNSLTDSLEETVRLNHLSRQVILLIPPNLTILALQHISHFLSSHSLHDSIFNNQTRKTTLNKYAAL